MKIYLVKIELIGISNGTYSCICTSYNMYSTLELAEAAFHLEVENSNEGRYSLIEKVLDTQEEKVLQETSWLEDTDEDKDEDEEEYVDKNKYKKYYEELLNQFKHL